MKQFKDILLYAGGEASPALAVRQAVALAQRNEAKLTLVDVLPGGPGSSWMAVPARAELARTLAEIRREELEQLAMAGRQEGLQVTTRVLFGKPFVELIREVQLLGHDLVIKTAQGPEGPLRGLLGSTALHLLRKCPCPVWVVKPDDAVRGIAVAAVDPDLEAPADDLLSRRVLELAASFARSHDLELEIVHAWRFLEESLLRGRRVNFPAERVDAMVEATREQAEAAVAELVSLVDLTGVRHRVSVVRGSPLTVIYEFTQRADVVVLGTLSRAGIAGVLIGNTAEAVLRHVDCSVIAVKPPGFVSPIRGLTGVSEGGR